MESILFSRPIKRFTRFLMPPGIKQDNSIECLKLNFEYLLLGIAIFVAAMGFLYAIIVKYFLFHESPLQFLVSTLSLAVLVGVSIASKRGVSVEKLPKLFALGIGLLIAVRPLSLPIDAHAVIGIIFAGVMSTLVAGNTVGRIYFVWICLILTARQFLLPPAEDELMFCLAAVAGTGFVLLPLFLCNWLIESYYERLIELEKEVLALKMMRRLSHEVLNPLAVAKGYVDVEESPVDDPHRGIIVRALDTIEVIVKSMSKTSETRHLVKLIEKNEQSLSIQEVIERHKEDMSTRP